MKKVNTFIIIICSLAIALFIWYMSSGVDRDVVYYNTLVTYKNVEYKNVGGEKLVLDILMPATVEHDEIPVVFYVHGGDFVEGDKTDLTKGIRRDVTTEILSEGYAIITINYRLLDEDTHFPENIADIKDAIRYIRSVSDEYNFDTNNFGIWGNSSGGYLALTVGYSSDGDYGGDIDLLEYSSVVNYVIDFSGITQVSSIRDVNSMSNEEVLEAQNELDILYGQGMDIYNLTPSDFAEMGLYDPIEEIDVDTVPTFIMHGLDDDVVDISQSFILVYELQQEGLAYQYEEIVGGNNLFSDLAESEVENIIYYVMHFIKTYYVEPTE